MELRDYLRILRKHWLVIVALTVLGAGAGLAYATFTTPVYTSSARVFVSTTGAASTSELAQGNSYTMQRVQTYSELVKTAAVIQPTIDALGLTESVGAVRGRVSATSPANTTIIDITAKGSDGQAAASLATEVARQLITVVEDWEQTGTMEASPVSLTVAQEAEVPGAPTSPQRTMNLAVGLVVGLSIGIGLALLISALDTKVRTERDLRRITTAPILGGIPFDPRARTRPLLVKEDSQGVLAEAYRSLRTNLQFLQAGGTAHSIVITSSVPGEGKSTTSANLAIAIAETQTRVLLVEADLRRPKVAELMGLEGGVGLTDVIIGRISLDDAIQPWGTSGLNVLSAGGIPPNPSELLGSPTMAGIARELEERYDLVLYDAAPLLPVTDAAVLVQHVGTAVVLVGVGTAHTPEVRASLESIEQVGVPAAGVVMSMLPLRGADGYTYRRRGHGYAYSTPDTTDSWWGRRRAARAARKAEKTRQGSSSADHARAGDDAGRRDDVDARERELATGANPSTTGAQGQPDAPLTKRERRARAVGASRAE